jgi:hypothetical protein
MERAAEGRCPVTRMADLTVTSNIPFRQHLQMVKLPIYHCTLGQCVFQASSEVQSSLLSMSLRVWVGDRVVWSEIRKLLLVFLWGHHSVIHSSCRPWQKPTVLKFV